MAPDPAHKLEETAALELLYALPSDATYEQRLIGWIVADVCARLGMPLPWANADTGTWTPHERYLAEIEQDRRGIASFLFHLPPDASLARVKTWACTLRRDGQRLGSAAATWASRVVAARMRGE